MKHGTGSQAIDFMFVNYSSETGIYDITAVDVTVSPTRAKSKSKKAVELFVKLLSKVE